MAASAPRIDSVSLPCPPKEEAQQTFRLQRYFSIASGIAILVVTFALSFAYRTEETEEQVHFGEARNVWMAQAFSNAIWTEHSAHLMRPFVDAQQLRADPDTARLHRRLMEMSQRVPVIKIKIYNLKGIAVYSSVNSEIGEDKSANFAFRDAREGKAVSELTHRGTMSVSEGQIENVDVVSTYIPIDVDGDSHVEAVFEIYTDVTDALAGVERETRKLVAGLVVVFALLYGILLLIVRRADRIIVRQYDEIAANEENIRAANRAKTEFLSSMSHELRTPMNAILGFAQLLESEPGAKLNENQSRFVAEILKAGRHLLDLINEVLDLARIEAGKLTLSVEPVLVSAVLAECMPLIQNMARERSIEVVQPTYRSDARVMADNMRLKQALLNLLSNAVKYNREGGHIWISITSARANRFRISVADTGPGIPDSSKAQIFRPFVRLGNDPTLVEGTGIGLALTRDLVKAMGGEIGFDSDPGKGATFWIDLPTAPADAALRRIESAPAPAAEHAFKHASHLLLYVEDNPANVLLMEQIAKRMSMRFLSAHNAELGLVLAAAERPDLIVMDINLPQMDGYEALKRLRANPATAAIPVMALSANAMDKDIARGLAAGFVRYETKPLQVDAMVDAIAELLPDTP